MQDRDGALLGLKYMFYIAPSVRIGLLLEMTRDLPSIRVTNWPKEISVVNEYLILVRVILLLRFLGVASA